MKKLIGVVIACAVLTIGLKPAQAELAGVGFDIMGSFYSPSDSRYSGMGTGIGINIAIDENLTMGYRVEEMDVRAESKWGAGTPVMNTANYTVQFQGITAYYRTYTRDNIAVDFGMWVGAATTNEFESNGAGQALTSPFVEPLGRVTYTTSGKVQSHVVVGVGYRFVRKFNLDVPFGGVAAVDSSLKNFDGLDILFGVGVSF